MTSPGSSRKFWPWDPPDGCCQHNLSTYLNESVYMNMPPSLTIPGRLWRLLTRYYMELRDRPLWQTLVPQKLPKDLALSWKMTGLLRITLLRIFTITRPTNQFVLDLLSMIEEKLLRLPLEEVDESGRTTYQWKVDSMLLTAISASPDIMFITTEIEPVVITGFGNRIGNFDQNKKTLSQFLGLRKKMIQRIGSITWVTQPPRSTRNRIRALHAAYLQTPFLWQQRAFIPEHLATPRNGSVFHRLLREITSCSLMGTTKALTQKRPPSTKLTRNKLTSIGKMDIGKNLGPTQKSERYIPRFFSDQFLCPKTDVCLPVRSEGVRAGRSLFSTFPTKNIPDLPATSDIECPTG